MQEEFKRQNDKIRDELKLDQNRRPAKDLENLMSQRKSEDNLTEGKSVFRELASEIAASVNMNKNSLNSSSMKKQAKFQPFTEKEDETETVDIL